MNRTRAPRRRSGGQRLSLAERYYERGLHFFGKGRREEALADLDEAIAEESKNAEYYVARGLVLLQNSQADEAEEDFAYALRLDASQWGAHYGRGMRAFQENEYAQAAEHFARAHHIEPRRPEPYFYRAVAYYRAGDSERAVRDMEFAAKLLAETKDKRRAQADEWLTIFGGGTGPRPRPGG